MKAKEIITEAPLPEVPPEQAMQLQTMHNTRVQYPYSTPNDITTTTDSGYKFLGGGAEAQVFKNPNDPSVLKIIGSKHAIENSASMQYLLLSRKYANSNPYLPRVDSIQQFAPAAPPHTDSAEIVKAPVIRSYYFAIRVEQLFPLRKATEDELAFMFHQTFGREVDLDKSVDSQQAFRSEIVYTVRYTADGNVGNTSEFNPQFMAAIKLIQRISSRWGKPSEFDSSGAMDLHEGNMMFRRTPGGPQLVLSDPLYNPGGTHAKPLRRSKSA